MESVPGPDLSHGIASDRLADGSMLQGTVDGEAVVLARRGDEFFAVGATCTHYGGPLAKGLIVGDQLRCPLHHACFSLRTGEVLRAPAFDSIPCWRVERVGGTIFVREKLTSSVPARRIPAEQAPSSVVIVGGGAAGFAAADTLRREGYAGPVTIVSADASAPYDRPNLSKDFLSGEAPEDWLPLRPAEYYEKQQITLLLNSRVATLDVHKKRIELETGAVHEFDRLLLATGAEPIRLPVPGAAESQIFYLRTEAQSRALAAKAATAKQVLIVGGSFIGLEVAAALRERGVTVHVAALERQPLERVLGPEIGAFIRHLHESHGVTFHLEDTVTRVEGSKVTLRSGATIEADLIVLGVGVRPAVELAERAGLKTDRGVLVDDYLETSAPGIFAAGDIARFRDPRTGERIRVEHWVVAERQGQVAARNMLGRRERYDAVPFFWTRQFGVSIKYVGHAESWHDIVIDGNVEARDCLVRFERAGRTLAVATISRDLQSLKAEAALEASTSA